MIDSKWILNLKGKEFVLFAGLLDLAHQNGLIAIENEVLLDLSNPEKDFWVVRSLGRFRCAEGEAVWSAHGDAGPGSSQMRGAYLRHAETRAAARMLRMATNIGMASVEELGNDADTVSDHLPTPRQTPPVRHEPAGPQKALQRPTAAPTRPDGGPGERVAQSELPVYKCGWLKCGAVVEERVALAGLKLYGHIICREHAPAAKAHFEAHPPVLCAACGKALNKLEIKHSENYGGPWCLVHLREQQAGLPPQVTVIACTRDGEGCLDLSHPEQVIEVEPGAETGSIPTIQAA